eukprot:COSAG02_NODE_63715_length_262_cov_0.957055_1_plen_49_part_01
MAQWAALQPALLVRVKPCDVAVAEHQRSVDHPMEIHDLRPAENRDVTDT